MAVPSLMAVSGMLLDFDGGAGRFWPFPVQYTGFDRDDVYAFNRAGRYAEITAGAFVPDNRMHQFCCTQYRVYGTGLDTECAADAYLFINDDDGFFTVLTMFLVQWFCIDTKQVSQRRDCDFTAGGTLVDIGFAGSHCFRVWTAAGVGALPALRLWQQGIDSVYDLITFYAKANRCITQYQANQCCQASQCKYRG